MATTQDSPKAQALAVIEQLPDDATMDDILRELAFARMIAEGLADIDAGRLISSEDMKREIESWARSSGPHEHGNG